VTERQRQRAADIVWEHWAAGTRMRALPAEVRPMTRREGYGVQALLEQRSAHPLYGWKIAATSKVGQQHIAVDGPLAGRLLRERVRADGREIPYGTNHMRVAEAEFAFRMGRDLLPRGEPYTTAEVLAAVASFHPAIEVPDSRFDDYTSVGAPQLIADNACAHYFVLGPAAADSWRSIDLVEHRVVGRIEGKLEHEGKGANVLGDPRGALTWLANELSALNLTLAADQVVTTGTCIVPLPIEPGDRIHADFGVLGSVSARMGADRPAA
jgi:2-keto-4-pentenoate hydratase